MNHAPLKIIHNFPYAPTDTYAQKRAVVYATLDELQAQGFSGIVTNVNFHEYTQNDMEWAMLNYIASEVRRRDMRLWIYDEFGYPSGGAGGLTLQENPDFEALGMVMRKEVLAPAESLTIPLPQYNDTYFDGCAYVCSPDGTPTLTHGRMQKAEGLTVSDTALTVSDTSLTLQNHTNTPLLFTLFFSRRLYEGTHCVHNVFEARRYIDVTNPDAVAAFLRNTYDKYATYLSQYFPQTPMDGKLPVEGNIEAFFTDEPSLMGCYINKGLYPPNVRDPYDESIPLYPVVSYGRDVARAYMDTYQTPLTADVLAHIFLVDSDFAHALRQNYHSLLSKLYETAFFAQIQDWCAKHNTNFSGHLLLEDQIKYHTVFEGNYLDLLRHMHLPGIDMLYSRPEEVRQFAFTPLLVSSIAQERGRYVMSEVSAHANGGNVTPDEMYTSLCTQIALGVNVFTSYYSSQYSQNVIDAATYKKYNTAIGEVNANFAKPEKVVSDVYIYYPIETFQRRHKPSDAQYGIYSPAEEACQTHLEALMNSLLDRQITPRFMDLIALQDLLLLDKPLLLPPMDYTPHMVEILQDLTNKGMTILRYAPEGESTFVCPMDLPTFDSPDSLLAQPIFHSALENTPAIVTPKATEGVLCRCLEDDISVMSILLVNTTREYKEMVFKVPTLKKGFDGQFRLSFSDPLTGQETSIIPDEAGYFHLTLNPLQAMVSNCGVCFNPLAQLLIEDDLW